MKGKGPGIRFQLIAGIVIMTIAGIGLIGVLSIKIVERGALLWKISQAGNTVAFVRASFGVPERATAREMRLAEALMREASITDFKLTSGDGRQVVSSGRLPDEAGELIFEADGMLAYRYGGGLLGMGEYITVQASLPGANRLEFGQSLADIKEDMAGVKRFLAVYAVIDSLIIIAFGVYFVSRSIVQPLRKLEVAATRIAGGKLYERADVTVDNEVGSLAASFNSMAGRLEDEIKSLERVNLELTNTQEELLRNSTLAAVGRLAAGIAHEIGNPLGALGGYMEILSRGGLEPGEEKDIIGRATREIDRIDSIVREFLEVARPAKRPLSPVEVNSVIRDTLGSLCVRSDFSGIETEFAESSASTTVMAEEGKLRQVFTNLLINAAQAMEGSQKKVISISSFTERRPVPARAGRRKDDPPAAKQPEREFVIVNFRDTGSGVGPEDSSKIFEPFFTTKEVGKGTGLGLFVSQSIIRAYGGEVAFRNVEGGAEFTVMLPAGEREPS